MKLVSFRRGEALQPGALVDGHVADLSAAAASLLDIISSNHEQNWLDQAVRKAPDCRSVQPNWSRQFPCPDATSSVLVRTTRRTRASFSNPASMQLRRAGVPTAPVVFTKAPSSVIGPEAAILANLDPTNSVDYEGELGVVIGRGGRGISRTDAMDHVFGYTIINDVTARTLQHKHKQWFLGKSIDSFCPMGPTLVTADEIPDPTRLKLETRVNGELRQNAVVSDLIFDIPTLIETISRGMTLMPGDIIATGTPEGVGIGFTPPKYLNSGILSPSP